MSRVSDIASTLKSIGKILLQSRSTGIKPVADPSRRLIILGNGPSLRTVIDHDIAVLRECDTMAVNYAANTPEFFDIRPRYYTIADPHFFRATDDYNVARLLDAFNHVDWSMQLFIPTEGYKAIATLLNNDNILLCRYNAIGIEGCRWFTDLAFDHRLGMPRPRNVLIPSIMIGCWLGYREIYLAGADHSWTTSLSVDEDNNVITNLPHYYAENSHEEARVKAVYAGIPLHALFLSYHIAFKAYHEIQAWAARRGISIYNATPGSFIDAFPRHTF